MLDYTEEESRIVDFRLEANQQTYAAKKNQVPSSRPGSIDFRYDNGDFSYYDTYVGGKSFAGEEAISYKGQTVYAMNYCGRVLDEKFDGDFLKEALLHADSEMFYRGSSFYQHGMYTYRCQVDGDIKWFSGYEVIYYREVKVYECRFHGGLMKE